MSEYAVNWAGPPNRWALGVNASAVSQPATDLAFALEDARAALSRAIDGVPHALAAKLAEAVGLVTEVENTLADGPRSEPGGQ